MTLHGWTSVARRTDDGAVESSERVMAPFPVVESTAEGARRLAAAYWPIVESVTGGVVRARQEPGGVEVRFLGRRPLLLGFAGPELSVEDSIVSCRYRLTGGLLSRSRGGEIAFSQATASGCELRSEIRGFHPALAPRAYSVIQSRIHLAISRRYFAKLLAEAVR